MEKGDSVKQGQVLVRLENDEYRAQVLQASGNLDNLKARLAELLNGSRPQEIAKAKAELEQTLSDFNKAHCTLTPRSAL